MCKHFECSLKTKSGQTGVYVESFLIRGIEAQSKEEAEKKAEVEIINNSPWMTEKYHSPGAIMETKESEL